MERNPPKDKLGLGVVAALTAIALLSLTHHETSTSDALERDTVLNKYHVSPQARAYIDQYPFADLHTTTNGGGHAWLGDHWEVYSNQDEAILHEASHMYSNKIMNPDFCAALDANLKEVADARPEGDYFHNLYYDVRGMKDNCTEEYASLSSESMGNKDKMPPPLQPFFQTLYLWNK